MDTARRLAWATDIHLNFLDARARRGFYESLRATGADAWVITGDIAEAPSLEGLLVELGDAAPGPVYFVLGNHDFYRGDVATARATAARLSASHPRLRYLPTQGVVDLGGRAALVGHDGWADGAAGDFFGSTVFLNDYMLIADLLTADASDRLARLRRLAGEGARYLEAQATQALARFERVLVATHVPPFLEACWHEGRISDAQWSPHFTSVVTGERLRAVMERHPTRAMEVLCGHTHGEGTARILPNLLVRTGGAEYGSPAIAGVLEV